MSKNKSQIVYSTEGGKTCPSCGNPVDRCTCDNDKSQIPSDGVVRIRREVKGRKGKPVTIISGIPVTLDELKEISSELKRKCGSGGSVKENEIIIQGDHRNTIMNFLTTKEYTVKKAGG